MATRTERQAQRTARWNAFKANKALISVLLLVLLASIWGSSFILIKRSLVAFHWSQVAALRIGISMLWFLPVVWTQFKRVPHPRSYRHILVMSLFGSGIPAFLFPLAQTHIDSSLAGILNSLTPIFVLLIGALFFGIRHSRAKYLGVLLGIVGAVLLIWFGQAGGEGSNNWYGLFALGAAVCYAISSNTIQRHLGGFSAVTTTSIAFLMTGPWALLYLFSTDFLEVMHAHPQAWMSLGSVATLASLSTAFATVVFVRLIQMTSAVFGSMTTYLIPIAAIAIGFFDGEVITVWHFVGIGFILGGVYLARGR